MDIELKPNERVDDLLIKGLKIIQNPQLYCFSSDAVELANFVCGGKGDAAVDLGSGTGIIPILLAGKKGIRTTGIELQAELAEMSQRSVRMNGLEDLVDILNCPVQELRTLLPAGSKSIVVTNPPYRRAGSGAQSDRRPVAIARHEICINLDEILDAAAYLLPTGGRFFIVHQTQRMAEVICKCSSFKLQPKRLKILTPNEQKDPHIFLLQCIKEGAEGLSVDRMRPVLPFDTEGD